MRTILLLSALIVLCITQSVNITIYDGTKGQLVNNFQNWSWGTVNLQSTTVVRSGSTYSLSFDVKGYTAIYLHGDFYFTLGSLKQLNFWVNGGTTGNQAVVAHITSGGNAVGSAVSIGTIPANSWVLVTIPFSAFSAPATTMLDGVQLQANTNDDQGNIYVDGVQFEGNFPSSKATTVTVKNTGRVGVSPYIYGVNFASQAQIKANSYTVNRWGGNAVTRYNYITDSSNHASDWYFEDLANTDSDVSKLPVGSMSYNFINDTLTAGAKVLFTTPTIGWRPFDRTTRCGFGVDKYGPQQQTDPYQANCGNGVKTDGTQITGNDPHDTSVESDPTFNVGWIKFIDSSFGKSVIRWFQLDNEPGLWHSTHRDVHPHPLSYDELWNYTSSYAAAYKAAFPDSIIFGPICWGWCSYMFSPQDGCSDGNDRKAHSDLPLLQWYIQQIANYQASKGVKLVDVIDVHYYPQAADVTSNKEDPLTALLRLRSPRGLWDPNYSDESWIGQPIMIVKRINDWITAINPGSLKVAISEYSFGSDDIITTALANVNALGVFARQGVYLATRWVVPDTGSLAEQAFKIFLNYDGAGAKVTGDSVDSDTTDSDVISPFAYNDIRNRKIFVVFINNVGTGAVPVTLDVSAFSQTGSVRFYSFAKGSPIHAAGTASVSSGKFNFQAPAWSANLAVVSY